MKRITNFWKENFSPKRKKNLKSPDLSGDLGSAFNRKAEREENCKEEVLHFGSGFREYSNPEKKSQVLEFLKQVE